MNQKKIEQKIGLISAIDLKQKKMKLLYWTLFAILMLLVLICLAPPLWVITSSTKDINEFYSIPPTIIPKSFHPEKISEAWNRFAFGRYYINTLIVTGGSILFSIISNGLAGFVLSKLKPAGSKFVFILILGTMMVPTSVSMVPTYMNIIDFPILHVNLTNTFWPMLMMAGCNAFMVIVYKSFFDGIPTALLEAGQIDGCNELQNFAKIILPLSKPVLFTSVILTLNATWGDFFWPYMVLKDKKLYTVIVEIFQVQADIANDQVIMLLTFAIVPPAILFIFFQKHIMQGFTMSGIKG